MPNMGFNDTVQLQAWSLVADVGGTNARFAAVDMTNGQICEITYFSVAEHQVFADVIDLFLHRSHRSVPGQSARRKRV